MAVVYQTNKKSGITYAYESSSYWVPELNQPRSKRTYLGRVDDDGNIIPCKRIRKSLPSNQLSECQETFLEMDHPEEDPFKEISRLNKIIQEKDHEILRLKSESERYRNFAETVNKLYGSL